MPENEFEKQVQQKIDELKFDPSAEVWENVAAAIAKRKKERWGLAIIFLTLLLIGTAIFILFNHSSNQRNDKFISDKNNPVEIDNAQKNNTDRDIPKMVDTTSINKPFEKDPVQNRTVKRIDNTVTKKINDQPTSSTVLIPENKNPLVKKNKSVNSNSVNVTNDRYNIAGKQRYQTSQKPSASVSNSNVDDLRNEEVAPGDTGKSIPGDNNTVTNDIAVKVPVTDHLIKDRVDNIKQANDSAAVALSIGNKKDTTMTKKIQSKQKSGWEFGFNFSLGVAATRNGYLGIIGLSNGDESKALADLNQSTGNIPGQVTNPTYVPSEIKPGVALVLGVFLQRNISSKTRILFGLNYRTYSSVMMTGTRVDSSNLANNNSAYYSSSNYYYRSGTNVRYKNNFHFIELPVAFKFKLSKQNKMPVYLSAGVSIAQLISSNALQFDTSSGRYFSNNDLLNKTQFNLSAGLLFSVSKQAKNPFLIGPDLSFSVSKMANSGLYKNSHYSYLGITVQKTIGKK
jgi:hypothetical protein